MKWSYSTEATLHENQTSVVLFKLLMGCSAPSTHVAGIRSHSVCYLGLKKPNPNPNFNSACPNSNSVCYLTLKEACKFSISYMVVGVASHRSLGNSAAASLLTQEYASTLLQECAFEVPKFIYDLAESNSNYLRPGRIQFACWS